MHELFKDESTMVKVCRALHEIAVATGGVLDPAELGRLVGEHARALLDADSVAVRLWDPAAALLRPLYLNDPDAPVAESTVRAGEGGSGLAFARREPVVVPDYHLWEHRVPALMLPRNRSLLAVPLLMGGRAIGALAVGSAQPGRWTEHHAQLLMVLAAQVAPALEAARLYTAEREAREAAQRELARREALLRVARQLAAEPDATRLLTSLLHEAMAALGGDVGTVRRWDEERGGLLLVASTHALRNEAELLRPGEGVSGRAFLQRQSVIVAEYQQAPNALPDWRAQGVEAALAAPLLYEGRCLGTISVGAGPGRQPFTPQDAEVLELLAAVAAAALVGIERSQLRAITLAARQLAHLLNNDLTLAVGLIELLGLRGQLPADLAQLARDAARGLAAASERLRQFQQVVRIVTRETPVGPALDLERATRPEDDAGG